MDDETKRQLAEAAAECDRKAEASYERWQRDRAQAAAWAEACQDAVRAAESLLHALQALLAAPGVRPHLGAVCAQLQDTLGIEARVQQLGRAAAGAAEGVANREPSKPRVRDRAFLHGDLVEVADLGAAEYFERSQHGHHVVKRRGEHFVIEDESRIKRISQRCGCRRDLDGPTSTCDLPYGHTGSHRWGEVR